QHLREPLEAHAGVDVPLGERVEGAVALRSYCWKTKFQISIQRPQFSAGEHSCSPTPACGPRSMNTSLHGPHSPVGPGDQKLVSSPLVMSPSRYTRSGGSSASSFVQMSNASSSSL